MSRFVNIFIALLIPLALILAWSGGQYRTSTATIKRLGSISDTLVDIHQIGENLYTGKSRENPEEILYIAHVSKPGYGGPMEVAAVVDGEKNIRYTAVLSSPDTRSYLKKVFDAGILSAYTDTTIEHLPKVDAVSGASLSSMAIIKGIEDVAQQIGSSQFSLKMQERKEPFPVEEMVKILAIVLFFLAAFWITGKRVKKKAQARNILLVCSVALLGFWFGAQFSLSTVVTLLSFSWLRGMATYAALLCLVLTIASFLFTRKNLFCIYICPFGAVQEGLGKILGCSAPIQKKWMTWTARFWVFLLLLAALYYQAPSFAMYEPFGKAFNFIGSGIIYSLTILIVLASLFFKRPWCHLFCPTTVVIAYLRFTRKSFSSFQLQEKRERLR